MEKQEQGNIKKGELEEKEIGKKDKLKMFRKGKLGQCRIGKEGALEKKGNSYAPPMPVKMKNQ